MARASILVVAVFCGAASGVVEEAAITIATRAGRTIASVTVASTQKARVSTSTNCRED
jgi:hypothetical protein